MSNGIFPPLPYRAYNADEDRLYTQYEAQDAYDKTLRSCIQMAVYAGVQQRNLLV
ncbi:hypothetical protein JYU34_016119 [Plutella xylostella]|uniref:Uncharacterized protein n=1 Tax=Plutella xylostella TaxID=51655 RepID=A0ABQ7Q5H5_PLUXY|nr:hypothetical protein JYU34_016119 [Plutella xylostella]